MRTKNDIQYKPYHGMRTIIIPKGTKVIEADNLPGEGLYWVESWDDMGIIAESWQRNYGFLVNENEVEKG